MRKRSRCGSLRGGSLLFIQRISYPLLTKPTNIGESGAIRGKPNFVEFALLCLTDALWETRCAKRRRRRRRWRSNWSPRDVCPVFRSNKRNDTEPPPSCKYARRHGENSWIRFGRKREGGEKERERFVAITLRSAKFPRHISEKSVSRNALFCK